MESSSGISYRRLSVIVDRRRQSDTIHARHEAYSISVANAPVIHAERVPVCGWRPLRLLAHSKLIVARPRREHNVTTLPRHRRQKLNPSRLPWRHNDAADWKRRRWVRHEFLTWNCNERNGFRTDKSLFTATPLTAQFDHCAHTTVLLLFALLCISRLVTRSYKVPVSYNKRNFRWHFRIKKFNGLGHKTSKCLCKKHAV